MFDGVKKIGCRKRKTEKIEKILIILIILNWKTE